MGTSRRLELVTAAEQERESARRTQSRSSSSRRGLWDASTTRRARSWEESADSIGKLQVMARGSLVTSGPALTREWWCCNELQGRVEHNFNMRPTLPQLDIRRLEEHLAMHALSRELEDDAEHMVIGGERGWWL